MKVKKGEPQTAREKMLAEEKAKSAEDKDAPPDTGKKWKRWRYQGDRNACFFVVGAKCFKTENAACQAAKCKSPAKCATQGAGPATVMCAGGPPKTETADEKPAAKKKSKKKG